jgi:hypothetical protein
MVARIRGTLLGICGLAVMGNAASGLLWTDRSLGTAYLAPIAALAGIVLLAMGATEFSRR